MTQSLPPQGPHESDELMSGEADLRALYRKLPQNEPSPALDAAVLRAAADAVSSQHSPTSPGHSSARTTRNGLPRWLIGLGSAATLVLAVGLAWRMRSMPQVESPPPVTQEVTAQASSNSVMDESRVSASAGLLAPAATPPPPPMPAMQPPPPRIIQADRSGRSMKAVAERTTADRQTASTPPTPSAKPASMLGEVESKHAPVSAEGRAGADKVATSPVPIVSVPPTAPPTAAAELSMSTAPPSPSTPPAAPAAPVQEMAAAPAIPLDKSEAQDASPAEVVELDEIRRLFAEHDDEEAHRRLQAFHHLHPQWQLPQDLQARLRKP